MLAQALVEAVGDEHCDVTARARNRADKGADDAAGEDVRPDGLDGLPIRQHVCDLFVRAFLLFLAADDALDARDDLGHREQTDQRRDELEAFQQAGLLIGDEARDAVGRVEADGAQQHAEEGAHKTLGDGLAGDGDDHGEAEDRQHEHFAGAEVHGHIRNDRGEEGHNQRADDAADEGREHGDGKRLARLTLLAHRVAVQQRGRRGRGARRVNQDGGNRAAVHAAAVDAQQQADGRNQIHAEGEGDQQRHAHRGGHARNRTEQNAAQRAEEGHQKHLNIAKDGAVAASQ